jgi:hypothetical protein
MSLVQMEVQNQTVDNIHHNYVIFILSCGKIFIPFCAHM